MSNPNNLGLFAANLTVNSGNVVVPISQGGTGAANATIALNNMSYLAPISNAVVRSATAKFGDVVSVKDFGAIGDVISITGASSITAGASVLIVTGAAFVSGDVSKTIIIPGAGSSAAPFVTTIAAWTSSTTVTLSATATVTLSSASITVSYGTNDGQAFVSALATGLNVFVPRTTGGYVIGTANLILGSGQWIESNGLCKLFAQPSANGSLFSLTGYDNESGISNFDIDLAGSGTGSSAIRFKTASSVVWRTRIKHLHIRNHYRGIDQDSGTYIVENYFDDIHFTYPRGPSVVINKSQGFNRWKDINIDETLACTGNYLSTWSSFEYDNMAGVELYRCDHTGQVAVLNAAYSITGITITGGIATATTAANPNYLTVGMTLTITGANPVTGSINTITITGVTSNTFTFTTAATGSVTGTITYTIGANYNAACNSYKFVGGSSPFNTFIWLDRVRSENSLGGGINISGTNFIHMGFVECFATLGLGIYLQGSGYITGNDIYCRGANDQVGTVSGAHGISLISCTSILGTNWGAEVCNGHGIYINNTNITNITNIRSQNNIGWGLLESGTSNNNTILSSYFSTNTLGAYSLTSTTSSLVTQPITSTMQLLATVAISNIPFPQDIIHFTSAYDNYLIVLENIIPVTNAVGLGIQTYEGGSFATTGYKNATGGATTYIDLLAGGTVTNAANYGVNAEINLRGAAAGAVNNFMGQAVINGTGGCSTNMIAGFRDSVTQITGIRLVCTGAGGNVSGGTMKIYGIK